MITLPTSSGVEGIQVSSLTSRAHLSRMRPRCPNGRFNQLIIPIATSEQSQDPVQPHDIYYGAQYQSQQLQCLLIAHAYAHFDGSAWNWDRRKCCTGVPGLFRRIGCDSVRGQRTALVRGPSSSNLRNFTFLAISADSEKGPSRSTQDKIWRLPPDPYARQRATVTAQICKCNGQGPTRKTGVNTRRGPRKNLEQSTAHLDSDPERDRGVTVCTPNELVDVMMLPDGVELRSAESAIMYPRRT
ncbi:hypothetical protein V8D89_009842 [Ganoderma adspersum]